MKLNGFAGEVLFIEEHIEENEMKYSNNELRERWKAIKRQAWNDDEFNEQVEKFEKYAVEEIQRVQENANIKLRLLEEKYKQDREEIMKGLYADEKEINDSFIEIIDEIYNEIPKESRVKNTTSMRQLLLRIWAEQANCLYISSWNERENGSEMLDCGRVKGKKKNEVGGKAKGGINNYTTFYKKKLDKAFDIVMGKFYDEDKDCMVGAHEFLSKDNRIKLTEENVSFLQDIFSCYYVSEKEDDVVTLIEKGKTSEIGYAQRMALRIGMEALSNNPNIRITNEMVEMRWLDLFGSTKDEANWAYDELRENLKIIFELPYKTKDECVACRKASQAIEKCDREIRSIISEYCLDPTVDYNKINEELEELKKRIVERRAELNK